MRASRVAPLPLIALVVASVSFAPPASSRPIADIVARMSLREKIGQLVMYSVYGENLSSIDRELIRNNHFGAVILFGHNYRDRAQLRNLTAQIQRAAKNGNRHAIGALIAADQEGGNVKRFPDMPPHYSAPEIGAKGSSPLAFNQGRATGRAMHSAGVNVNLAPVADLDLPPQHVMRSRSFGSRKRKVGRLVNAFSRGLQARRTAAAVKHFPGLGGAEGRSDYERAVVRRTKWQLHHIDAFPFHKVIAGGARMIMLSHAVYPRDGGSRPASVNRYIATTRLRNEFDFTGVAISDALGEVSRSFGGSTPRACKASIKAGVDIALLTHNGHMAARCARAIRIAVRNGAITRKRLDQAVTRVLELKRWLGVLGR